LEEQLALIGKSNVFSWADNCGVDFNRFKMFIIIWVNLIDHNSSLNNIT